MKKIGMREKMKNMIESKNLDGMALAGAGGVIVGLVGGVILGAKLTGRDQMLTREIIMISDSLEEDDDIEVDMDIELKEDDNLDEVELDNL